MNFQHEIYSTLDHTGALFDEHLLTNQLKQFEKTIRDPEYGFFSLCEETLYLNECQNIFDKFQNKNYFVHVGIGGSSLGPEMLIHALQPSSSKRKIFFINNVDPESISDVLQEIKIPESLFYFVSKSGGTAETMAALNVVSQILEQYKIEPSKFSDYIVFCTDPIKGDLRALAKKHHILSTQIPQNVGGRYSVLSSVGILPALFAEIPVTELLKGARDAQKIVLEKNISKNFVLQLAATLTHLKVYNGINQTVLMPYSSKWKLLSFWFVQLWAESLGKVEQKQKLHEGLTPIPAVGATDQHSQLQLYMDGPKDKFIIFLELANFSVDHPLKSTVFLAPSTEKLSAFTMGQLIKAELEGTCAALREIERPYFKLKMPKNDAWSLGFLIQFFESLTVIMGQFLNVNPFDQPGVEASKIHAFNYLKKIGKVDPH